MLISPAGNQVFYLMCSVGCVANCPIVVIYGLKMFRVTKHCHWDTGRSAGDGSFDKDEIQSGP